MKTYTYSRQCSLLFVLWFACTNSIAQKRGQEKIDSLLIELHDYKPRCKLPCLGDSIKVRIMSDIGYFMSSSKPDSAFIYFNNSLYESEKINWKVGIGEAYYYLGRQYNIQGEFIKSITYYDKAMQIWNELEKTSTIKGRPYFWIKQAKTIYNNGNNFFSMGNYNTSLELYTKASLLAEKAGSKALMASFNINIGLTYRKLNRVDLALEYYKKALKLSQEQNNIGGLIDILTNIGAVHNLNKNYDSALSYFDKAYEMSVKNENRIGESRSLQNKGAVYLDRGTIFEKDAQISKAEEYYKMALIYFKDALQLQEKLGNKDITTIILGNLGSLYTKTGQYKEAEDVLLKALPLATETNHYENMTEIALAFCDLYEKWGVPAKSVEYYKKAMTAKDSFYNEEKYSDFTTKDLNYQFEKKEATTKAAYDKQMAVAQIEKLREIEIADKKRILAEAEKKFEVAVAEAKQMQSDAEKRIAISDADNKRILAEADKDKMKDQAEKQIATSKAESDRQKFIRNAIIFGAGMITLSSLFSFIFYKRKRDEEQKKEAEMLKTETLETELKALRSQMNPHFIFNSLRSVQTYILNHQTEEADKYLIKFSKLIRAVLENSEHKEVAIEKDIDALKTYMDLERIKLIHPFTYEFILDDNIDLERDTIPSLILQPFVENAIWHGFQNKDSPGHIKISISKLNDLLYVIVEDNGMGRELNKNAVQTMLNTKTSFGINVTMDRLKNINKLKNKQSIFKIIDLFTKDNLQCGTRVELSLPI